MTVVRRTMNSEIRDREECHWQTVVRITMNSGIREKNVLKCHWQNYIQLFTAITNLLELIVNFVENEGQSCHISHVQLNYLINW